MGNKFAQRVAQSGGSSTNAIDVQHAQDIARGARDDRTSFLSSRPEDWHSVGAAGEPAFQNTWDNTGFTGWSTAGFYKDSFGRVYLRGLIRKNGGAGSWVALETIFTLPDGYRPPSNEMFAATSNSKDWMLFIRSNGEVQVGDSGGATNPVVYASLSGASFRVV